MVELLIERWCEPPASQALHLSTLIHQVLSVIAEHGGVSAKQAYDTLCIHGPFRCVDPSLFSRVLRQIGSPDVQLIEQAPDGNLLLGTVGEKLVEHYSFYAVFQTPEEFRVVANGRLLGDSSCLECRCARHVNNIFRQEMAHHRGRQRRQSNRSNGRQGREDSGLWRRRWPNS